MKRFVFLFIILFLFACERQEFPPEPSRPGEAAVGMALGGIPIGAFPNWAAPLKYTDVTPEFVKSGDTIKVTVERPASDTRELYIFGTMYEFDRQYNVWNQRFSEASQSGTLKGNKWHMNKAVFSVPVNSQKFPPGLNYVVVYWCADNGYNAQGRKLWDCNGAKWLLGAFEQVGVCGDSFVSSKEVCDPPGQLCPTQQLTTQNGTSIISAQTGQTSIIGSQTSVTPSLGSSVQYVCASDCKSCVPTQTPVQVCGNNKLEVGEDCEPPYNPAGILPQNASVYVCKTINGTAGLCNQNCLCIPPTKTPPPTQPYCGNNVKEGSEECDGPSTTPANATCSNCSIVCDPGFVRQGDLCVQQASTSFICPPTWVNTQGAEASFFLGLLNPWQYNIMQLNAAGQPTLFASVYLVNPFGPVTSTNLKVVFASQPTRELFGTLISQQHNYPMRDGLLFESNPFASGKADYLLFTLKSKTSNRVDICWKAAHDYPINKPTVT